MAKEFAKEFYRSAAWQRARGIKWQQCQGLCERCLKRGIIKAAKIIHHKVYLTEDNINRPEISLNPALLEALCQDCHNEEHSAKFERRYDIDGAGNILPMR